MEKSKSCVAIICQIIGKISSQMGKKNKCQKKIREKMPETEGHHELGEGFSEHEKKMNTNITSTRTPTQTLGIKIQTQLRLYHSFIRLLMLLEMFLQARYGKKRQQTYNMLLFIHPCVWGYIFCEVFIFLLTSCLLEKKKIYSFFRIQFVLSLTFFASRCFCCSSSSSSLEFLFISNV